MGEYEEKVKYYENLYKPKSSTTNSTKTNGTKKNNTVKTTTATTTTTTSASSSSSDGGSSTNYDDYIAAIELLLEELRNLKAATNGSKGIYDNNISSLRSSISTFDPYSPIMGALASWITNEIGTFDCDSRYDRVINDIQRAIDFYS